MLNYLKHSFQAMGEFQSRLILTLFYILVMPLFAILAKLGKDELDLGGYRRSTSWRKRGPGDCDLESARRQY